MITELGRKLLSESTKLQHKEGHLTELSHTEEANHKRSETMRRYFCARSPEVAEQKRKKLSEATREYIKTHPNEMELRRKKQSKALKKWHSIHPKSNKPFLQASVATQFKTGHEVSNEIREKISLKKRGRKQTRESVEKRRQSLLNNPTWRQSMKELGVRRRGPNHPNWKGGISGIYHFLRDNEGYREWRKKVYRRDGWVCQTCGSRPKKIIAHHIKSFTDYPELRYNIDNGVTLCRSCHLSLHQTTRK